MTRCPSRYLPHAQAIAGLAALGLLAGLLAALPVVAGCGQFRWGGSEPSAPSPLPAFVYPQDPPLVDAEELRRLLVRLDSRTTVLWVFDEEGLSGETARSLAFRRDELRAEGVALLGLYTGSPEQWQTGVIPKLRAGDANFPCAVADPQRSAGLGTWLSQTPAGPEPGVYVVSGNRSVVARSETDENSLAKLVDGLLGIHVPATMPAGRVERLRATVRLMDLATGATLCRSEAQAADPVSLAAMLASQLQGAGPPGPVAVLPFRESVSASSATPEPGLLVADRLGQALMTAGWPNVVSVYQARDVLAQLDLTALSAEFTPGGLLEHTSWKAILVGSIDAPAASGRP